MLPQIAIWLKEYWGPFRLLESYLVLIGFGTTAAGLAVWYFMPRLWHYLPTDRGRLHAVNAQDAKHKPTGAGLLVFLLTLPWIAMILPLHAQLWRIMLILCLCMITGYLDDRSSQPWGEALKGSLDLAIAMTAAIVLWNGQTTTIWLPLIKGQFDLPAWLYIALTTAILWFTINATNCSDGVDGLAGTLTMLSLFYLGGFLYVVIGHLAVANYLLVPHNARGAAWALIVFAAAGGLAGYLWHNAHPSAVLMGDAGSRYFGLLVGIGVMAAGNPVLVMVVAPVVLVNGGTGLFKVILLRILKKIGLDVRPLQQRHAEAQANGHDPATIRKQPHHHLVDLLHSVRFPLHDHARHRLGWSNTQVLLRFVLIQTFLTPLLFVLMVKLR